MQPVAHDKRDHQWFMVITRPLTVLFLLSAVFISCEDYAWTNPMDANTELDRSAWRTKDFEAKALNNHSAQLSWSNDEQRLDGFYLYRAVGDDSPTLHRVTGDVREFVDEPLEVGVLYTYRVEAYAGSNQGGISPEATVFTTFPFPVTPRSSVINDGLTEVSWSIPLSYVSHEALLGLVLERRGLTGTYQLLDTLDVTVNSYLDSTVEVGQSYYYRLSAFNTFNQSQYRTSNGAEVVIAPPHGVSAVLINDQHIQVNWLGNSHFSTAYRVYRHNNGNSTVVGEVFDPITAFSDTTPVYGESYTYSVTALTAENESDPSVESGSVTVIIPPPTTLRAVALDDQSIRLSWVDNCTYESGYRIYRDDGFGSIAVADVGQNAGVYIDSGLSHLITYVYSVVAFTQANESEARHASEPPMIPIPTNIYASIGYGGVVTITWSDNSSTEISYTIERDIGSGFETVGTVNPDTEEFLDMELDQEIQFCDYRVFVTTPGSITYTTDIFELMTYVDDNEGNRYRVVKLGNNYWMSSNLRATRYRNGDPITFVPETPIWLDAEFGAYTYTDNDISHAEQYGALYNWYVGADLRGIAPEGWHIASVEDFQSAAAPFILKPEYRPVLAGDCAGFRRFTDGSFGGEDNETMYWSIDTTFTRTYLANCNTLTLYSSSNYHTTSGFSIRCVRDEQAAP